MNKCQFGLPYAGGSKVSAIRRSANFINCENVNKRNVFLKVREFSTGFAMAETIKDGDKEMIFDNIDEWLYDENKIVCFTPVVVIFFIIFCGRG